jgi:protein-disulfide isomerase
MSNKMTIRVFSFACCNPQQAVYDQQYIERIKEALDKTELEAQVDSVFATDALSSLDAGYIQQLRPLFDKYGMAVAPALFIDGELVLYGVVPPVEELVGVIGKRANKSDT